MTTQELKQVEGMKKVIAEKGEEARKAAEGRINYLEREIKAMKSLNESYNIQRLAKFESQLRVIKEVVKE